MTVTVTALLVSHDGARWLPTVLDGLAGQTRLPDRVVAVDTGSHDDCPALLARRLGEESLVPLYRTAPYGEAVTAGLKATPAAGRGADEWVWLLHDDSSPAPDALAVLLEAAETNPSVSVIGPKLREWPSLRRLLEVGVTISGTGRRETGLERGEYDQGQHDAVREVLAVNTAGMLVRRDLLEALGFDRRLPMFGNDIDFGWRAARAGHHTMVVPDAIVFHAEAASRGLRRTRLTTDRYWRAERRAALFTLLVNCSFMALPFQAVRLFFGSLLRALGFLLVRAPGEALDEIWALAGTYVHPGRVIAGRARRRRTARVRHKQVRHLLAPPWLPYRHGLDFVADFALALVAQAGEMSARRRSGSRVVETGPVPAEAQNLPEDNGLLARLLVSPTAWMFTLLVVASAVSARSWLGSGFLSGGGLLPAPDSSTGWWQLYMQSWHDVSVGSSAPTAPYVLPLALASTVLFGKAWLLVDLIFFFAVPLAAFGGYRFLRRVTQAPMTSLWGALAYGLLPVLSGAVQEGRLGTVVALILLPWLANAALFLAPGHGEDRRWRAAWRCAVLLALLAAFVPLAWPVAALVTVVVLLLGLSRGGQGWGSGWFPVVVPLLVSLVLLLPWALLSWVNQGPASWVFEAGRPAPELATAVTPLDVLLGRPGIEGAAPAWLSAGIALAAVVALVRPDTRPAVLKAWTVVVVALAVSAAVAGGTYKLASSSTEQPAWLGFPVLLAQAAGIAAAALAGAGVRKRLGGSNFGWRQPVGVLVVAIALLTPVAGLAWWVVFGTGGVIDNRAPTDVPTYMTDAAAGNPDHGILVVSGGRQTGFDYQLLRAPGLRLGEDSVLPTVKEQRSLTHVVTRLVTAPEPSDINHLAAHGVSFVYGQAPADTSFVGNMDSVSGVTPGSAITPGARAWQINQKPTRTALADQPMSALHPALLVVQGLAVLTALVLAAPTRKARR